jgi:hypothetical protein
MQIDGSTPRSNTSQARFHPCPADVQVEYDLLSRQVLWIDTSGEPLELAEPRREHRAADPGLPGRSANPSTHRLLPRRFAFRVHLKITEPRVFSEPMDRSSEAFTPERC